MDDKPIPRWQKLAALALFIVVLACLIAFRSRLAADFWPPDASRVAPNILAAAIQAVVVFVLAILLWPPWRRRLHRLIDLKLAPLHKRLDEIQGSHGELHRSHDQLHARLARIEKAIEAKRRG